MGLAQPSAGPEIPDGAAIDTVLRNRDESHVLGPHVDRVVRDVRDPHLELARQVLRSVDRLVDGDRRDRPALVVGRPDLEVRAAARRQLLRDLVGQLAGAGVAGPEQAVRRRRHHVAVDIAARRQRRILAIVAGEVAHQWRELRPVDVVVLNRLAGRQPQRAIGKVFGRIIERGPLRRRQLAAGGALDAHHEDVVPGLATALATLLLLVDPVELRELLPDVADRLALAARELIHLFGEGMAGLAVAREEQALALGLDPLVLRHLLELRVLEADDGFVRGRPIPVGVAHGEGPQR